MVIQALPGPATESLLADFANVFGSAPQDEAASQRSHARFEAMDGSLQAAGLIAAQAMTGASCMSLGPVILWHALAYIRSA